MGRQCAARNVTIGYAGLWSMLLQCRDHGAGTTEGKWYNTLRNKVSEIPDCICRPTHFGRKNHALVALHLSSCKRPHNRLHSYFPMSRCIARPARETVRPSHKVQRSGHLLLACEETGFTPRAKHIGLPPEFFQFLYDSDKDAHD